MFLKTNKTKEIIQFHKIFPHNIFPYTPCDFYKSIYFSFLFFNIFVMINSLSVKLIFLIKFSIYDKISLLYYLGVIEYGKMKVERLSIDYIIREIQKNEYPLLNNFLYETIFIADGTESPPQKQLLHLPNCKFMLTVLENYEYRGLGIGTAMMKEILALLKAHG